MCIGYYAKEIEQLCKNIGQKLIEIKFLTVTITTTLNLNISMCFLFCFFVSMVFLLMKQPRKLFLNNLVCVFFFSRLFIELFVY